MPDALVAGPETLGRYNHGFYGKLAMDAERLNLIASHLADLAQRGAELRRYL